MRPASAAFLRAVGTSHRVATRLEVLDDGDVTLTIDSVTDGTVTLDQTAASRGRLDCSIIDPALVPGDPDDALAPYGNEVRAYRGAIVAGAAELISLGVFRIDDTVVTDTADGVEVRVSGLDRSARIADARFEAPYIVAAGTNVATAIHDCLAAAWPGIDTDLTATSITTPLLVGEEGGDRWRFVQDMAASIGHALYFNGDGVAVTHPVTTATGTPTIELAEGDGGVLLTASRRWTRQGTYNRVIATGENPSEGTTPARGVATDDNPASPTYYYGAYGRVPRFYSSQFLATDTQAADAAAAILARELGTTQSIEFGAIVNPALEPDDLVTIRRARAGINEAHIIDALTIPLTADQGMTGRTRAVVA